MYLRIHDWHNLMFRSHVFLRLSGVTKSFNKASEKDNVTKELTNATCLASLVEMACAPLNVLGRVYAWINNKVNLRCRAAGDSADAFASAFDSHGRLTASDRDWINHDLFEVKTRRPCLDLLKEFMQDSFYRPPAEFWLDALPLAVFLAQSHPRQTIGQDKKNAGEKVSAVLQWATSVFQNRL